MSTGSKSLALARTIRGWSAALAAALVLVGVFRIASTYPLLSHTVDEPAHIAAGLEWWTHGAYTLENQHPPLARVMAAGAARLVGAGTIPRDASKPSEPVLYDAPSYRRTLTWARASQLPFFVAAAWIVWLWTERIRGRLAALLAVALFTTTPVVLGNAGLATTDIGACASYVTAMYAFRRWMETGSLRASIVLGLVGAVAMLVKFNVPLYLAVSLPLLAAAGWPVRSWRWFPAAIVVACLSVWAVLLFRIDPYPLAEIYRGFLHLTWYDAAGHDAVLFGELRRGGFWHFFPVLLVLKSPLPLLALAAAGIWASRRAHRDAWVPPLAAGAILLLVTQSALNLGVRHVLPVYPLLAIAGGCGAAAMLARPRGWTAVAGVLLAWQGAVSLRAYPDFFAYYNELAGSRPEDVHVDSDLDWGQDLDRLSARLRELNVDEPVALWLSSAGYDPARHGIRARPLSPWLPTAGWVAVSIHAKQMGRHLFPPPPGAVGRAFDWLDRHSPERVGSGFYLYKVPAAMR